MLWIEDLRSYIFKNEQPWKLIDPSYYLSPFLDVISSDGVPAGATAVALSSVLKIMKLDMFSKRTPGAREIMSNVVMAVTGCRLEKTHPVTEGAVMMKILQVLAAVMRHPASILLNDHAVCTIVNTCFQVVQQSAHQGDLLQRTARHTMHDMIQIIFSRLAEIEVGDWENSESDTEESIDETGYGIRSAVDIFHFLCSLLNVIGIVETEGSPALTADEDVQVFALVLINSALELSGESIGKHKKLLRMVQDDLFHHLIHYGTASSSPLVLSMICSTVWNIYYFHRESIRLQLEAFFVYVLFKTLNQGYSVLLQELALEGIINFCRHPTFLIEVYLNYDCDPLSYNVFEDIGKYFCKHAFLSGGGAQSGTATWLQLQAFDGLTVLIHNIADNVDKQQGMSPKGPYPVEISEYKPFWEEVVKDDTNFETWIESVRIRKVQKRKMMIAGSHFNRDEKKGMDYLKISKLISDPPDPKGQAMFLRYAPGLDKTKIGDFLGDPSEFNLKVLKEFTDTFELTGLVLDTALRTYLETFRLPGESQKIQRILEAFSERFYEQQSSEIFVSKDAVFILCYSVIMLNTDQHNPQVKKKMTEDEFIRNNRAINGGQDLPREILSDLFQSIATKAITIFGQNGSVIEMNPSRWIQVMNRSKLIQPYIICDFDSRIGRDMFAAIAGPTVATLSAIFEHTEDEDIINECIQGLFAVARICQYGLQDSLDELISSFCKFTTLLNPYASAEETLFSFGHDMKPRMATVAVFTVANNFKDSIRGGWRNIIDCLLKLKRLQLLPQSIIDSGSSVDKNMRLMDLMADSVKLIAEGLKNGYSDPGSGSTSMIVSSLSVDDNMNTTMSISLFLKLGEVLRKTSLARREEVRNYAVTTVHKSFINAEELCFTPANVINCFNVVIFAMVDDLHEKMLEYSSRENAERETRSMEGTLALAMEFLVDVYLRFLKVLVESSGFKTFWLGILRRMDSCMKSELGVYGESKMKELVPSLLKKMITVMQEKQVLVPKEGNDLWEITFIQMQWIAPWLKDELFPDAMG
ncbi:hypothetical protein L1987_70168 [Smallanthus sonchifolius]|uniref:Uncharacterized protein n=1 Tax=Smallanthus sonchifolius TaxID=185202 RepID=A0ACB9AN36_9ASTR|nr:hypothetical protein L1987_70168 [Smallanthus sonchifolius]